MPVQAADALGQPTALAGQRAAMARTCGACCIGRASLTIGSGGARLGMHAR